MTTPKTNPAVPTPTMKRDDYKAVKHMNKAQLEAYLGRIYMRGFEAGVKFAQESMSADKPAPQE